MIAPLYLFRGISLDYFMCWYLRLDLISFSLWIRNVSIFELILIAVVVCYHFLLHWVLVDMVHTVFFKVRCSLLYRVRSIFFVICTSFFHKVIDLLEGFIYLRLLPLMLIGNRERHKCWVSLGFILTDWEHDIVEGTLILLKS